MDINEGLLSLIKEEPSVFHTTARMQAMLEEAGFERLSETRDWKIVPGGNYVVTRNGSSLIAFSVAKDAANSRYAFRIAAAHGDSPAFKLKDEPEISGPGSYLRLNVEAYGGMIDSTWLDRPLGLAGRVMVREGSRAESRLYASDRDLFLIPNLCIHFNRDVNKGYTYNRAVDLCPLAGNGMSEKGAFRRFLAKELGVAEEDLLSWDLFLVNRTPGSVWGIDEEFISAPRLDDLQCACAGIRGFLEAENPSGIAVYCCFDNEEVGSGTKQGAMSTFLKETLSRVNAALGHTPEELSAALAGSFFISADNAHAVHPNHPEKTDEGNACRMNGGIVIKENAAQHYMTDAFSRAVVKMLCEKAGVPYQTFANRSDVAGGSTLGNLSNLQVSLHGADIGLAQLAMHSSYETAGAQDTEMAVRFFRTYFSTPLRILDASEAEWA